VPVERADALVVGAGLVGAATAFHLARRRYGRVIGLEVGTPAAGATGRAAGIVSEQAWNRWDVDVIRESKEEYRALAARVAPGTYRTNGFVRWTADERVAELVRERLDEWRAWGVNVRELHPSELDGLFPGVRSSDLAAIAYAPEDAVAAPSALAEAYVAEGRRLGVDWRFGAAVDRLTAADGGWSWTDGTTTYRSPVAVIAAGAWSKRLLEATGAPVPLAPYRTQAAVLSVPGGASEAIPSFDDLDSGIYARPEENGRVLAGNGTEGVEADPTAFATTGDDAFVARIAEGFDARVPAWSDATVVRAWAGVCVATPDRRPVVGELPGAAGLYAITGFNGFGVMRAAGAASRLAEAIAGGDAARERLRPADPARFGGRSFSFAPKEGFTLQGGADPEC
jgi:sarcosine oxidase, subunit beta